MKSRLVSFALGLAGWGLFSAAIGGPAVCLIAQAVSDDRPDLDQPFVSWRIANLIARTMILSASAALGAVLVAIPGAYVIGRTHHRRTRAAWYAIFLFILLCPPMVYAFGWERLLPNGMGPATRCWITWVGWAWPIPALFLGLGWRGTARRIYDAARLETAPPAAFLRMIVPALWPHAATAWLVLFVIFFGDYGVPHACGLVVFATETLGWAADSMRPAEALRPAWPGVAILLIALAALVRFGRRWELPEQEMPRADERQKADWMTWAATSWLALTWIPPLAGLTAAKPWLASTGVAFRQYGGDLAVSLAVTLLASTLALLMVLSITSIQRARSVAFIGCLLFAALPGALVGAALVCALNRPAFDWLYVHWPVVALGAVARFAWLPMLATLWLQGRLERSLGDQVRMDGLSMGRRLWNVEFPLCWPVWLCTIWVTSALALGDVATTSMLRVPSYTPISLLLVEKFHRFEDAMVTSLSLWLMSAALPAALFLLVAARARERSLS